MKHLLVALSVCLLASAAYGTKQVPEKILYNGQECLLACVPLEKYFDANHPKPAELRQTSTNCWRGYIGTWEVKDNKFYVRSLGRFRGDRPMEQIPCSLVFKDQKPPIEATWYTGVLRIPQGKILRTARMMVYSVSHDEDLHAGFQRADVFWMYERDIYIRIERGNVISEHLVDNKGKGATQSVRDWGWVASGSGPVKDGDFKWHDFREVASDAFSQYKQSGESFRTRCIFWTDKKNERVVLWIPATPATEPVWIPPKSMPENHAAKKGEHVEVNAHFEKEATAYSLHVDSICPLKPGETMHHSDFKPSDKPSK